MNVYNHDNTNIKKNAVRFYDLGSGTGKVIFQVYMQVPRLSHAVGVELSPTRHHAAVRAYKHAATATACTTDKNNTNENNKSRLDEARASMMSMLTTVFAAVGCSSRTSTRSNHLLANIELLQGDLFSLDLSNATHIWISSVCFPRKMMEKVSHKIVSESTTSCNVSRHCKHAQYSIMPLEYRAWN
jgi:Histone methylation protein DOT1